ncbi:MAG: UDP-N-acetylmuramoyl-L-alanine--D-glutamate ligase, partial [Erysipelotrichaceae bacterium]|nr:UDP-N-acetylmuramoyl-L-alanine--D-glutamate ligase [Erysipelotrichaceae bacterium]
EIALRDHPEIRYLAITGTNGKTTTTTMLGEMLKKLNPNNVACGNVGLPVSEVVMDRDTDNLTLAIEIAGFQLLGCYSFHPLASVIMNLTPDHVDYFGTVDAYYKSKTLVYQNQNENDFFIMNVDDENVREYCKNVPCQIITLSLTRQDTDLHVTDRKAYFRDIELFSLDKFRLPGMHNVQNALVAGCMAFLAGVKPEDIRDFLETFMGVEHRIEYVAEIDGVRYYNDSKGTNVDSTIMALKAFDCPVHLLVGGYDKKTGFADLKPYVGNVRKMYAFGTTKDQFIPLGCNIELFDNMEQALNKAHEEAEKGEVVLLSPACASWDQFPNYEVRGKLFKQQVHRFEDN